MTLRTIEGQFSQDLLLESKNRLSRDLTLDGAIVEKQHPKVLWAQLQFQENPRAEFVLPTIENWSYDSFPTIEEAKASYPEIQDIVSGHPYQVFNLINNPTKMIFNFSPIGVAVLGKENLKNQGQEKTLPYFLHYAFSEEMWGEEGKWTRFHKRLVDLFESRKLLKAKPLPGYYLLDSKVSEVLEKSHYQGTHLDKDYLLVLPWTFSLSDLENFEKILGEI